LPEAIIISKGTITKVENKVSPRSGRWRELFWNEKPRIKKPHRRNLFYHNKFEFVDI
jgi:hypothetical protein